MKQTGRWPWPILGLALVLLPACSRQPGLLLPADNAPTKPLPFDTPSHSDGISPTQAFASAFIPAGTTIVIRLQSPLSSEQARLGDTFHGVLEEPIIVQGQTLAPSGTGITGRVLAAKVSDPREPGYLRLTLSSIVLNGKPVQVHSSSIFSKGGPRERLLSGSTGTDDTRFSTGRRLTFRLLQPLPLQG